MSEQHQEEDIVASHTLAHCTIECKAGSRGNYFLFVNPNRPERPLRMYKSAVTKLVRELPKAFEKAKEMEQAGVASGSTEDVALINKMGKSEVVLYVQMFEGKAFIYLRLFVEKEQGVRQPCTYGVQFSTEDSVEELTKFSFCL